MSQGWWELKGVVPAGDGWSAQAARSSTVGGWARLCQPSTLRKANLPEARSAQNSMAAVSARRPPPTCPTHRPKSRRSHHQTVDFDGINAAALSIRVPLLRRWLQDGCLHGVEYTARNPRRQDRRPGSFKINICTGRWSDFATGARGGDVVKPDSLLVRLVPGRGFAPPAYSSGRGPAMIDDDRDHEMTEGAFLHLESRELALVPPARDGLDRRVCL